MRKLFLILISLIGFSPIFATEVDNFSIWDEPEKEASEEVNKILNDQIQKTIERANSKKKCEKENPIQKDSDFFEIFKVGLDQNWPEIYFSLMKYLSSNPSKGYLPVTEYVFWGSPSDWIVDIKGHRIGIDKIDHMFGHGFVYYERYLKNNRQTKELFEIGHDREQGMWGLNSSVESWADKAANYRGFEMWRDFFEGDKPMFSCVDGRIVINFKLKIEKYVDHAMDESINCSNYRKEVVDKMLAFEKGAAGEECPVDLEACEELKRVYGKDGKDLLHPRCLNGNRKERRWGEPKAGRSENVNGALDGFKLFEFLKNMGGNQKKEPEKILVPVQGVDNLFYETEAPKRQRRVHQKSGGAK